MKVILGLLIGAALASGVYFSYTHLIQPKSSFSSTGFDPSFYNCQKESQLSLKDLSEIPMRGLKKGTKIKTGELVNFDPSIYEGKTLVFLVSATWCGYCKYDISKTMEFRKKSDWPKDDVVVLHMSVPSGKESIETASDWVSNKNASRTFQGKPLDLDGVDYYFAEGQSFTQIQNLKTKTGQLFFSGIAGTPYALIFDSKGSLRFRGHYTGRSEDHSADYDEHYNFIGHVAQGKCES